MRVSFRAACLSVLLLGGSVAARADAPDATAAGPFVTPSVDVDVHYAMVSPQGVPAGQEMRWQASSLRQRIDPQNSVVYMVTSWKDGSLTVIDTLKHRLSRMPAPGSALTLPGHVAPGNFQRLGTDVIAGQYCVNWRTTDQDGHTSDVCYTPDGILVRVMQDSRVLVQAVAVDRAPQPDSLFTIPADFSSVAPAH